MTRHGDSLIKAERARGADCVHVKRAAVRCTSANTVLQCTVLLYLRRSGRALRRRGLRLRRDGAPYLRRSPLAIAIALRASLPRSTYLTSDGTTRHQRSKLPNHKLAHTREWRKSDMALCARSYLNLTYVVNAVLNIAVCNKYLNTHAIQLIDKVYDWKK